MYKNYAIEALQLLSQKLGGISDNVFFDIRPATVPEQMKDFMTINANNRWVERNAFQYSIMTVNLFYRVRQNNVLPLDKTQAMVDKVLEVLPYSEGRFLFHDPYVLRICKSDGMGFGYATVQIRCQVNTTDKFN